MRGSRINIGRAGVGRKKGGNDINMVLMYDIFEKDFKSIVFSPPRSEAQPPVTRTLPSVI